MEDIEALRSGASRWSMAGDKQLLDTLQSLHQKIVTKCTAANSKLSEMVTVLDDASVHLQNVNNKFMALSNSQFIESRVYDDDITTEIDNTQDKEPKPTPSSDPHQNLLTSLQVLESFHEAMTILPDSESSSSDDEDISRVVLKPKDVYAGRPLPYIIGSHAWKTKWHAGVIQEESDTDSESKQSRGREQYSDSEPEDVPVRPAFIRGGISTPSSLSSSHLSATPLSPADVANELARRLGATAGCGQSHAASSESPAEPTTTRKVYGVDKPATTTVFSDEPPPLPSESDEYSEPDDNSLFTTSENTPYSNVHKVDNEDSEPEDIFAELKRKTKENKPYDDRRKVHSVADDLFGFVQKPPSMSESTPAKRISTLSPEQLDDNDNTTRHSVRKDSGTKKPIGGISLFGTTKNNKSIGAAILKRHQRESSDESDDSCQNNLKIGDKAEVEEKRVKNKARDEENGDRELDREKSKEKDLLNDLFAKTKEVKKNKSLVSKNAVVADIFAKNNKSVKNSKTDEVKETKKKVDLFNDNIFDDIDDIFTSNVSNVNLKEPNKEKPTKSLFDDDNDLFNEIEIKTVLKESQNSNKKDTKSIFDSDDELFSEKITAEDEKDRVYETKQKTEEQKVNFGEKVTKSETNTETKVTEKKPVETPTKEITCQTTSKTTVKSLFDSDDDDIFTKIKMSNQKQTSKTKETGNRATNTSINTKTVKTVDKIDIFADEDDDENIFFTKNDETKVIDKKIDKSNNIKDSDIKQSDKNFKKPDIFSDVIEQSNPIDQSDNKNETEQKISKTEIVTDIFNDIPPEFEKPKEPKKSKNVNALFDDDSDDETFFKKNDTLIDDSDKPEPDFSPSVERIFGLFDEPPAIDVDFIQKHAKNAKIEEKRKTVNETTEIADKNVNFDEDEDDIFKPNTVIKSIVESKNTPKQSTDDLDGTKTNNESLHTKNIGKLKPLNLNINVNTLLPGASPKKQQKSSEQTDGQITSKGTEITSKSTEKTSESTEINSKSTEELVRINEKDENLEKLNTKLTKSVSFDEKTDPSILDNKLSKETDPSILDNKLSKERAKIQVKRRPSTRRARREAVKTSGIDFGEDSTDNSSISSSFDDHKDKTQKSEENTSKIKVEPTKTSIDNEIAKKSVIDFEEDSTDNSSSFDDHKDKTDTNHCEVLEKPTNIKDGRKTSIKNEIVKKLEQNLDAKNDVENKNIEKDSQSTDVKSKLVYILHDEDIFTDTNPKQSKTENINPESIKPENINPESIKPENIKPESIKPESIKPESIKPDSIKPESIKPESINPKSIKKIKILNIIDDDDELFKTNSPKTSGIETLGKVYSESETRTDISKERERESDEDIFKDMTKQITEQKSKEQTKTEVLTKTTRNKQKSSLFDDLSDSEEELFGKTKKKSLTKNENKNKPAKNVSKPKIKSQNLFSSDSEEDLFGSSSKRKEIIRTKTQEVEVNRSKTQEIEVKNNKEVKGSLFSDIEDDDLFGTTMITGNKILDSKKSSAAATEQSSAVAEPVFDDPLSLLGDEETY